MLVLHGGEGLQGWQQVAVVLQVLQGGGGGGGAGSRSWPAAGAGAA